jgi:CHAT domain-containing protein
VEGSQYGEPRYVAYVLRQHGEVRWRELGSAKEIDASVDSLREALRDPQRKDVRQLSRRVDQQIMQPLRDLLGDSTQLIISPDGQLNLIPFAALLDENENYLVQRYTITYITTGRDLLRKRFARESKSGPLIIANPAFGDPAPERTVETKFDSPNNKRRTVTSASNLSEVYFAPLAATALEANTIKTFFPNATVLTGTLATESAVKRARAPTILHIATHGFFLQPGGDNANETSGGMRGISTSVRIQNPLMRSGLALAEANVHTVGTDDGILTAFEASGLNLWGTRLVVLSACDTGLGDVRNGEGVYGLRRAFVLAGAESLVMSLWPVSDRATRELMTSYYENLNKGLGRSEALKQVQLGMLKRNPQLHPFYWANFIQSGDWTSLNSR